MITVQRAEAAMFRVIGDEHELRNIVGIFRANGDTIAATRIASSALIDNSTRRNLHIYAENNRIDISDREEFPRFVKRAANALDRLRSADFNLGFEMLTDEDRALVTKLHGRLASIAGDRRAK